MTYTPILDPPLVPEPTIQYWKYEAVTRAVSIPSRWLNDDYKWFPWPMYQGNRGICVGASTVYGLVLKYWQLTKDYPTKEQLEQCKKNVEVGFATCTAVTYQWFPQMKSAQFAYMASREEGNVTHPEGSYLSASVASLKKRGCCFEKDCLTSITFMCVPQWHPVGEEKVREEAAKHCIDGYLSVNSFDSICEAIYRYGFVLMPINVYSNYRKLRYDGSIGMFPDPSGSVEGSHALCWIGYDKMKRELYCLHSWGDEFPLVGGISEKYYREAAGTAFVVLDESEDKVVIDVAEKLYSKVTCMSNVPCKWYVDDELRPGGYVTQFSMMMERHTTHHVRVVPEKPFLTKELMLERMVTPINPEVIEEFRFTEISIAEKYLAMIRELLKKIINWKK